MVSYKNRPCELGLSITSVSICEEKKMMYRKEIKSMLCVYRGLISVQPKLKVQSWFLLGETGVFIHQKRKPCWLPQWETSMVT